MTINQSFFKGALFLGGLSFWGNVAPVSFYFSTAHSGNLFSYVPQLIFSAISMVWILLLLRSEFFAQVRQLLKPFWLPCVLAWMIPVVGLMIASCIEGNYKLGFPLPVDVGSYEDPWTACARDLLPQMALIMLCVLAAACTANRVVKSLPAHNVRDGVLTVFTFLCVYATYWARDRFEYSWSTWTDAEIAYDIFITHVAYLAFWLCIALAPAWRITEELLALRWCAKPSSQPDDGGA